MANLTTNPPRLAGFFRAVFFQATREGVRFPPMRRTYSGKRIDQLDAHLARDIGLDPEDLRVKIPDWPSEGRDRPRV